MVVKNMLGSCIKGDFVEAEKEMAGLFCQGYSAVDVVGTVFRVCKSFDDKAMPESTKLAFIREIGLCHMRIADGMTSKLQLQGLVAKLCKITV